MTRPTYAELRRLHEAATPGPWKHWDADGVKWDDPNACGYDSREHHRGPPYYATGPRAGSSEQADADAALIAAMRNAIPGLLAEAEAGRKLREQCDILQGYLEQCRECRAGTAEVDLEAALAIQVKEQIRTFDEMHGAAKERARIVAELRARAKYLIDSYGKAQENAAYEIYDLADAIERGEL